MLQPQNDAEELWSFSSLKSSYATCPKACFTPAKKSSVNVELLLQVNAATPKWRITRIKDRYVSAMSKYETLSP